MSQYIAVSLVFTPNKFPGEMLQTTKWKQEVFSISITLADIMMGNISVQQAMHVEMRTKDFTLMCNVSQRQ